MGVRTREEMARAVVEVPLTGLSPHRRDVVSYSDKDLFFNSLLLPSEADMKILTESTVALNVLL